MPKTFTVGKSEVFRCWDTAIQVLHPGDKATLHCPASLAYGKAFVWPPVGGEPIPENSDVNFDIEVEDCNIVPTVAEHPQPVTTTMQPNECFYLQLVATDHTSLNLVLSHNSEKYADYWPAWYSMVEHKVVDDPAQQWKWDEATGAIENIASGTFLDFDYGWAMAAKLKDPKASDKFPKTPRRWFYDSEKQELTTDIDNVRTSLATLEQPKNWGRVQVVPSEQIDGKDFGKWRVDYCYHTRG